MWELDDIDSVPPPAYAPTSPEPSFSPGLRTPFTLSSQDLDREDRDGRIHELSIVIPGSRTYSGLTPSTGTSTDRNATTSPSTAVVRAPNAPRYLYYQVFSPDGVVRSKRSFCEADPYTGRVVASHIAPPYTAKSVKRFLCKQEEVSDVEHANLLATLTSSSGLSDQLYLPVLAADGPGAFADDPMALIIKVSLPTTGGHTSVAPHVDLMRSPVPLKSFSPNPLRLGTHRDWVRSLAFSLDGTQLASGSKDGTICIWDVQTGQIATGPIVAKTPVCSVAFSPDGRQIVSGCVRSPFIRIWDVQSGTRIAHLFEGHTNSVWSVAWSQKRGQIASGSDDNTVRIWDARLGRAVVDPMEGHTEPIVSVDFSPDGMRVVSGSWDATVLVWDTTTGTLIAGPFRGHSEDVRSVAFSPNGRWIVSGSSDCDIRVWDTESNATGSVSPIASRCFPGHAKSVRTVSWWPDGQFIVSSSRDGTVRIWSFETGQVVTTLRTFGGQLADEYVILSTAVSPRGDRIVAGCKGGSIYNWNCE